IIDADGSERYADEIETDSRLSDGYAIGFSTRLPGGGTAIAQSALREDDGTYNEMERLVYSACEVCEESSTPTWAIRARRAILDENSQMMSYRDAVLEIAGVPVLYFPYFAHPDPNSGRRSGLLPPSFGTSGALGVFYQQPYYWAISPYQDLTISPKVMGNVDPIAEFEYRKRFWSGDLFADFSVANDQDFTSEGDKFGEKELRGHLFASGRFRVSDNWDWGFGLEQMSDDLYTRRYDIDGEGDDRGLYQSQPRRLLNQVNLIGQGPEWYADASLITINGLRARDNDDAFPQATPLGFVERQLDFGNLGLASVYGSSAILTREEGVDSQRLSVGTEWSTNRILRGGILLEPFADARFDAYELNDTPSLTDTVNRAAANAGARLSYPLYRPGKSFDLIIEPTVMAVYGTPGVNDPDIPQEDGLLYEFSEASLFESNAHGGYDIYESGSKASAGISARALWKNGVSLTGLAGRRWRASSDSALDETSNLDGTASDWVAGLTANFGTPLSFNTSVRIDDDDLSLNRIDAQVITNFWRLRGRARYYRLNDSVTGGESGEEGISMRGDFRLTDRYYFVYGRDRDIVDGRDLNHTIGLAYQDACSRFEIAFKRSEAVDRTLGPDDTLTFTFSLKTIGQFGIDQFGSDDTN
ncbi:MAG: LPS assembly protein LptD, partial [Pseudomonadota bacterium]